MNDSLPFPPGVQPNHGLESVAAILDPAHRPLAAKRRFRRLESIECVGRPRPESATQNFGFFSCRFVLCDLPIKRPPAGCLVHERRNGQFVLLVTGRPKYGLPWGQDRLADFLRIFGTTIFFGNDATRPKSPVIHEARFSFMSEARIWYSHDPASWCCQEIART